MGVFESFEVVPAVDLQAGEVVQLVRGERGTEKRYGDPMVAVERWVGEGARTLHVVDLDGAFEGVRANQAVIDRIVERVPVAVQVGGGIRSAEDAIGLLERGVDRVILGTVAVEEPRVVEEVSGEFPGAVMVSLDARDGRVVIEGWTEETGLDPAEAAVRYEELGAGAILFTDVDVEGELGGVRTKPLGRVVAAVDIPVVASGGVGSVRDIRLVREAGAGAVVVGTALYEGRFSLAEAIRAVQS